MKLKYSISIITIIALLFMAIFLFTNIDNSRNSMNDKPYNEIVASAKKEGTLHSLAMPNEWANWKETWNDITLLYGITHSDKDMSSQDELDLFAKGDTSDMGDVGTSYAILANKKGLTLAYKTSYWESIPQWAKDKNGNWSIAYTATMAFLINKKNVKENTLTWGELLNSNYTVGISDVTVSTQAQYAVYAAAIAFGGSIDNIEPGIAFFEKLAKENRLDTSLHDKKTSINSNIDVNIKWDFLALGYKDAALNLNTPKKYVACIPQDGSVTTGYAIIINKNAKNPHAASLAKEYIFSNEGQINLAKGYASPIRSVFLPKEIQDKRIPNAQYTEAMIKNGLKYHDKLSNEIISLWIKRVVPILEQQKRGI